MDRIGSCRGNSNLSSSGTRNSRVFPESGPEDKPSPRRSDPTPENSQELVDPADLDDLTYQPVADEEPAEESLIILEGLFGPTRPSVVESLSALVDAESGRRLLQTRRQLEGRKSTQPAFEMSSYKVQPPIFSPDPRLLRQYRSLVRIESRLKDQQNALYPVRSGNLIIRMAADHRRFHRS
jgi:hypothetical protein